MGMVLAYLVSLGQYRLLVPHEHAQQYWQLFMSESERTFTFTQNFHL
jgi:hypothetical protein